MLSMSTSFIYVYLCMKKKILIGGWVLVLILVVLFVLLKPQAPDNWVAVLTENPKDVLPLPQLDPQTARYYTLQAWSELKWTGRKVGWYNNGTVAVTKWAFGVDDQWTAAGKFVIDMNTIKIVDMSEDSLLYDKLLDHLRNGFFSVDKYPTVEFDLKKAVKNVWGVYTIVGDLTLRWVKKEITFPAQVDIGETSMTAKANFFVDRTAWGIDEVIQIADKYIEFGVDFTFDRK